jgi:hypothetical protein
VRLGERMRRRFGELTGCFRRRFALAPAGRAASVQVEAWKLAVSPAWWPLVGAQLSKAQTRVASWLWMGWPERVDRVQ